MFSKETSPDLSFLSLWNNLKQCTDAKAKRNGEILLCTLGRICLKHGAGFLCRSQEGYRALQLAPGIWIPIKEPRGNKDKAGVTRGKSVWGINKNSLLEKNNSKKGVRDRPNELARESPNQAMVGARGTGNETNTGREVERQEASTVVVHCVTSQDLPE